MLDSLRNLLDIEKLKLYQMELKLLNSLLFKMRILNFEAFMKNYSFKNDTVNESDLQRFYISPIYPRDRRISSDKGFVNIDNSKMGGT